MGDSIEDLVRHSMGASWGTLDDDARTRLRQALADTLAVLLAGSQSPTSSAARKQFLEWGGAPQSRLVYWGTRLPAPAAAAVNTVMARVLDFDDCHDAVADHPSVTCVPAALAVADDIGATSLVGVMEAMAAGSEIVLRLRQASTARLSTEMPWTAATYAPLASAVTAARVQQLSVDSALQAVGIAFTQMSNTVQSHRDGTTAHVLHHGLAVGAGVASVAFAAQGISGTRNVLEGPYGVFSAYLRGSADRRSLAHSLAATSPAIMQVTMKPYPCCRLVHGAIDAALHLGGRHGTSTDVDSIRVHVNRPTLELCGVPWTQTDRTSVNAQFSVAYATAVSLVRGPPSIPDFHDEHRLTDPKIEELTERIVVEHDPDLDASGRQVGPTRMELRMTSGETFVWHVDEPSGHPDRPLTDEQQRHKYLQCSVAAFGTGAASQRATELLETIASPAHDLPDVDEVHAALLRDADGAKA